MKTLKKFLEKNQACSRGFNFAKDLTLEQFLNTCDQGDWILWLFVRINPSSLRELTLAKAHCANTVRHLMKDERSIKAIDVAIAFGEGKATREELDDAGVAAFAAYLAPSAASAASAAADAAAYAAALAYLAPSATGAGAAAYAASAARAGVARKDNQKLTADICRKYLPIEIWNNN